MASGATSRRTLGVAAPSTTADPMSDPLVLGPAAVAFTGRRQGDLATGPDGPAPSVVARRRAVLDRPWTWLRQVHGGDVVVVTEPGDGAGAEADGAVTRHPGAALAVLTADCAPVALVGDTGVVGVAHAGWRGLVAGVVERTVAEMRALGAGRVTAALGPCIHASCYEFSPADLDLVARQLGDEIRGVTSDGRPALDVPAAVRAALARAGAELVADAGVCTACSPDHWSHRARGDRARQATVVWLR